ncbi:MAG TPA: hypothetical protein VND20_06950 [Candidatus Binataceae bacterium]|nr:hypothetical protein [Candidatus Binataceae bacterium]
MESHLISIMTTTGTFATAAIIWWQARLLRTQNQVQALLQLNSVWESDRMVRLRARWAENEVSGKSDLEIIEEVLEFLEEFAGLGLGVSKVLKAELIWDSTVGWHAARYYFYNQVNGNIERLRGKWLDETFYSNLELLWPSYLKIEARRRKGTDERSLEEQIRQTREKFLKDEIARHAHRIPQSPD